MNICNYRRFNMIGSVVSATFAVASICALGGCQNDAQTGALIGSGLGAGIGGIVGHNVSDRGIEGALIGAGIGALGGYAVGNESDKSRSSSRTNYDY